MIKTTFLQKLFLVIFGILLTCMLLEIGLRIGGFTLKSLQEYNNKKNLKDKTYKIMCIGESTTMMGGEYAYPKQLENILNKKNLGIKFKVINEGLTGTMSGVLLANLKDNIKKYQPDMIIAMIGINDAGDLAEFESSLIKEDKPVFKSLKIVKLAHLLWLHLTKKIEGEKIVEVQDPEKESDYERIDEQLNGNFVLRIDSRKFESYVELGTLYLFENKNEKAIKVFKQLLEFDPRHALLHFLIGKAYRNIGEFENAENMLKKAISFNREAKAAYSELADLYLEQEDYSMALKTLFKALKYIKNPGSQIYLLLAKCYDKLDQPEKAEIMFLNSIKLNPSGPLAYLELELHYKNRNMPIKREEVLKRLISIYPKDDTYYDRLALHYKQYDKKELSDKYYSKGKELRLKYFNTNTERNYKEIINIVKENNIKMVCVQYPMRSVGPLTEMIGEDPDIIFVDNEKIFKNAVLKDGYNKYFIDSFASDFGHCTPEGNRLLAENVANKIIKSMKF